MAGAETVSDSWRPTVTLPVMRQRARLLATLRAFFASRDVLEVETPLLSQAAVTDRHLDSLVTDVQVPGQGLRRYYLQTSPEFAMKRLLASGSGPIYQIARVFRNGERGRLHNPEFTMLEWYRPGYDHHALMDEVDALLQALELVPAPARFSYAEAFRNYAGVDPFVNDIARLRHCLVAHDVDVSAALHDQARDSWLDLILTHVIEPQWRRQALNCYLYDYPPSQAALARIRHSPGLPAVAERFELYLHGIEVANGYHELTDVNEQRRRFLHDLALRQQQQLPQVPVDDRLLAALQAGLPACAGIAIGIDRLLMVLAGVDTLQQVMCFPLERA
ncbi:MAG: EF-P lysine aminoacylase GenX [Gammaproteobacteria bacterium]|nr:EF-P lysine aminoacylase GenX [Gammaproteobacteria bacterium]